MMSFTKSLCSHQGLEAEKVAGSHNCKRLPFTMGAVFAGCCIYVLLTLSNLHCRRPTNIAHSTSTMLSSYSPSLLHDPHNKSTPFHLAPPLTAATPLNTNLSNIVFALAASAKQWEKRKHYIKSWWRPRKMRGFVWLDHMVAHNISEGLPPLKLSADTSKFKYTHKNGNRAAIRISRVVSETFRIGLHDVKWFVMGDDDTVFIPENLVKVLSKYDPEKYYYIGSSSETHTQNIKFSYNMAYGGGGFAVSYPLAKALEKIQDSCLHKYPYLFGSDDRIQACMAELGVPLTKEPGFHQFDIYGDASGLLTSHPVAPLVSLHHLDYIDPLFPDMTRLQGLQHLLRSGHIDPEGLLQQSFCFDNLRNRSFSISWGYMIQVHLGLIPPRLLELPRRTFSSWYKKTADDEFAFSSQPAFSHDCAQSAIFYTKNVGLSGDSITGHYTRKKGWKNKCKPKMVLLSGVESIKVVREKFDEHWYQAPHRQCCKVLKMEKGSLQLHLGACEYERFMDTP